MDFLFFSVRGNANSSQAGGTPADPNNPFTMADSEETTRSRTRSNCLRAASAETPVLAISLSTWNFLIERIPSTNQAFGSDSENCMTSS